MNYKPCEVPTRIGRYDRIRHCIIPMLQEMMKIDEDSFLIEFKDSEYMSTSTCAAAVRKAIRYSGLPFKVAVRDKDVYVIKLSAIQLKGES